MFIWKGLKMLQSYALYQVFALINILRSFISETIKANCLHSVSLVIWHVQKWLDFMSSTLIFQDFSILEYFLSEKVERFNLKSVIVINNINKIYLWNLHVPYRQPISHVARLFWLTFDLMTELSGYG
jgi:hypothetical protein